MHIFKDSNHFMLSKGYVLLWINVRLGRWDFALEIRNPFNWIMGKLNFNFDLFSVTLLPYDDLDDQSYSLCICNVLFSATQRSESDIEFDFVAPC